MQSHPALKTVPRLDNPYNLNGQYAVPEILLNFRGRPDFYNFEFPSFDFYATNFKCRDQDYNYYEQ